MENNPVLFEDEYVTQQLLSASIVEAAQVLKRLGVRKNVHGMGDTGSAFWANTIHNCV